MSEWVPQGFESREAWRGHVLDVPKTLRFTCERAGFETVELTALYRKPFSVLSRSLFLPATCLYVGRAREGWDYPSNSGRSAAPNARGFVARDTNGHEEPDGDE